MFNRNSFQIGTTSKKYIYNTYSQSNFSLAKNTYRSKISRTCVSIKIQEYRFENRDELLRLKSHQRNFALVDVQLSNDNWRCNSVQRAVENRACSIHLVTLMYAMKIRRKNVFQYAILPRLILSKPIYVFCIVGSGNDNVTTDSAQLLYGLAR